MTKQATTYTCSRCSGEGRIWVYANVLSGVCFQCGGSGRQKSKPRAPAVRWAVFIHERNSGEAHRIYNVQASTEAQAIEKARQKYLNASSAFRDEYSMTNAFAKTWRELGDE